MNRKITILFLILICSFVFRSEATAGNETIKADLLRKLSRTLPKDTTRLELYYQLTRIAENPQVELHYINKLMQEAEEQKHSWYQCRAYLSRMSLAYNSYDVEEVNKWMPKLESLARSKKYYDFLFLGKRCVIDMMLIKGEYERSEKEAMKMLHEAQSMNNKIGTTVAYQCLSNGYGMTYKIQESIEMREEAFKVASGYDSGLALEINSSLVRAYAVLDDRKNQLKWMKKMDKQLELLIQGNSAIEAEHALWISMNAVAYLTYYSAVGDLKRANIYIKQLDKYEGIGSDAFLVNLYMARCKYFYEADMMEEALVEADKLIQINQKDLYNNSYIASAYIRANILSAMERQDEAIFMYKRNLKLSDSINIASLNLQLDQIKKDYNTDTLLLKKEKMHWKIQWGILSLILVAIMILIFFAIHIKRIQKELKRSEAKKREMVKQMEQANIAKEKFLSAISSSINIPLNVVVKDSMQFVTDELPDKEMRNKISKRLNKASVELMGLINNILNLSKLEAGMIKFKNEDLAIIPFVEGLVTAKKFNGCPVELILPKSLYSQWIVNVDVERLKEVFDQLLVPSRPDEEILIDMQAVEDDTYIRFCITGTLRAISSHAQSQEEMISQELIRLLVENLGGSYTIVSAAHTEIACFTLPIVKD